MGQVHCVMRNKTNVIVINSSGGGVAATLDSNYYKGCGLRQGVEREFVVIVNESVSENNRRVMCEQPSGKLHGSGCIQQYASRDRKGK